MRGGRTDLVANFVDAATDELSTAVDDHLWGVDAAIGEDAGVVLLAASEIGGGERVAPAEMVPVIDMLFERNDFYAVEGLILTELFEKIIGGRAGGTAFGREEFEDDGLLGGGSLRGGEGTKGPAGEENETNYDGGKKGEQERESSGAHGRLLTSEYKRGKRRESYTGEVDGAEE
jgi:hypothetical protein